MINTTTTEIASESIAVASVIYTGLETPIEFVLGVLVVGIIFTMIIRAFAKQ